MYETLKSLKLVISDDVLVLSVFSMLNLGLAQKTHYLINNVLVKEGRKTVKECSPKPMGLVRNEDVWVQGLALLPQSTSECRQQRMNP